MGVQQDKYVAQFDYDAADSDEVSFKEGDIIVNVQIIDEGWAQVCCAVLCCVVLTFFFLVNRA